jgi:PBP1b-binding outer membrane lipoprotein LpoB
MVNIKSRLQKLMDKQRKKSEQYVQTVQRANKLKAESYSLYLKVSECREQLMANR